MRFYGLLAIFLMFTQASQASPGSIFDSLVEQTEASRRAPVACVDQSCGEEGKKEFVSLVADALVPVVRRACAGFPRRVLNRAGLPQCHYWLR